MPTMIDDDDEDYDDEFDSDEGDEEDEDEEDDEDEPLDPWYSRAWTYVNQSRAANLTRRTYAWSSAASAKAFAKSSNAAFYLSSSALFIAMPFVLASVAKERGHIVQTYFESLAENNQSPFGKDGNPMDGNPMDGNPMSGGSGQTQ